MNNIEHFNWHFPGGLTAFSIILALAIIALFLSYFFSLRKIPTIPKIILASNRCVLIAMILFILGNPEKTIKHLSKPHENQNIALIFDTSSSMTKQSFSASTRLDDSIKLWKKNFTHKSKNISYSFFSFDSTFKQIPSINSLKNISKFPIRNTSLFDSISQWTEYFKNNNVNAVFCFTDGIDNSSQNPDSAIYKIEASKIPHFFVPVETPLPTVPYASFYRLESPTSAKIGSVVQIKTIISTANIQPGEELHLTVKENSTIIYSKKFQLESQQKSNRTITFPIKIKSEGTHIFKAVLNYPIANKTQCTWSITGLKNEKIKILMFQGGLDWGTRFLRSVTSLENGKFSMDVKFAKGSFGPSKLFVKNLFASFPDQDELQKYNLVIMMKMKKSQLTKKIENELQNFVNNGGALLFIIANSIYASEFANSPIEHLLPVIFENINDDFSNTDSKTARFLAKMNKFRKNTHRKISFKAHDKSETAEHNNDVPTLTSMNLTEEGKISPIFNYMKEKSSNKIKPSLPKFQDFALITNPKIGASVLATHPQLSKNKKGRVLLAIQKYGKGRTAVLATDPLWRWKLSINSKDTSFFKFWSQLLEWLSAGGKNKPFWILPSASLKTKFTSSVKFKIPTVSNITANELTFSIANLNGLNNSTITMTPLSQSILKTNITPPQAGSYKLSAYIKSSKKLIAETIFYASDSASGELKLLKPSKSTFSTLSRPYNSSIIKLNSHFDVLKNIPTPITHPIDKISHIPLWNKAWMFILIISIFIADLIIRRIYKLL